MKKLILVLSASLSVALAVQAETQNPSLPKDAPKLNLSAPLPANLFVELAKAINPAVVNISTAAMPKGGPQMRDPMLDMLEQLYGIRMQQPQQQKKPQMMGLGTGFIIREDGLIVTNNHVIAGADTVTVQLSEGSKDTYPATVIGSDDRTDIALLKIDPKGKKLPYAVLGSSKDLQVGEWVAAFGNPFGHGHSMTKGIISSKGRGITEINKIPLLQTDASINPGNSGGPLVNTKGEVIGVNSAIDARAQGIGFAIPIDELKAIITQLETKGHIARGYIGTALGDLDEDAAAYLGMGDVRGAVITQLDPRGPAAKAGAKMYDIVTEFNGKSISSSLELQDAVSDSTIGKSVKVKIIRDRKPVTLTMLVSDRPEDKIRGAAKKYQGQKAPLNLGFTVMDPDESLRGEWNLPDDMRQPVVIAVDEKSAAAKAGLTPGDVILDVNKTVVETSKDVLRSLKKGSNTIRIARNARIQIVNISTP